MNSGEQIINNAVGLSVILGFFWLIWMKVKEKNPKISEKAGEWFKDE